MKIKLKILVALAIMIGGSSLQSCKSNDEPESETSQIYGHEYVDLGLSVKWATCNVGASSPEQTGEYYAFGEIETKETYSSANWAARDWKNIDISGTSNDVAHVTWGGTWRIPTNSEMRELINDCQWSWKNINGHTGYRITGPNGNSIFLPTAGRYVNDKLEEDQVVGYYNSAQKVGALVNLIHYENQFKEFTTTNDGWCGYPVRPVSN